MKRQLRLLSHLLFSFFLLHATANAQWVNQTGMGSATNYRSVHFVDDFIGVAVAEDVSGFSRTTDGGATWTTVSVTGATHTYDVHFANANVGYAVGVYGKIFKTSDGGASWSSLTSGVTISLNAVHFFDASTGIVVGEGGTILRTVDGGSNWTTIISGVTQNIIALQFLNSATGYAITETGGKILKTTDAGITWSLVNFPGSISFRAVFFVDEDNGWVAGASGLYKTTNGGSNWSSVSYNGSSALMYAIHFIDVNTGYIAGEASIIFKTTDAGASWTLQTTPSNSSQMTLRAFSFPSSTVGYVVGQTSQIKKMGTSVVSGLMDDVSNANVLIYPNPVTSGFTISMNSKVDKAELLNSQGSFVKSIELQNSTTLVNTDNLQAGTYFVKFEDQNQTRIYPVVIY